MTIWAVHTTEDERAKKKLLEEITSRGEDFSVAEVDYTDYESFLAQVRAERPECVIFGDSGTAREIAAGLAVDLNSGLSTGCYGLTLGEDGAIHWLRPVYDNSLIAETVQEGGLTQLGTLKLAGASDGRAWSEDMPIDDAEIVVCVGRGCGEGRGLELAKELAKVLGAALGATRAVTEAHTLPISKQIGQTGKYIRPRVYIGLGVAGAIQHLAGMRNSDIIIAVNRDARAPIFEQADYGIVGDLFEVLPVMIEEIRKAKA